MDVSIKNQVSAEMQRMFIEQGKVKGYLAKENHVLLAISGGVDSMVLLDLMLAAKKEVAFSLGVVHINHQLRPESADEAAYLKAYCQERKIPFILEAWKEPATKGIEAAARAFRYHTFAKIMHTDGYQVVMTAHHGNDQMETILMKIVRGGQLGTFAGIKESQRFSNGQLIRPLLSFGKEQLYEYAAEQKLVYFEDQTNQELNVQRNRIRHLVIPQLKQENPQVLAHFQRFAQQITWADQLIKKQMKKVIEEQVKETHDGFVFPWRVVQEMSLEERYYFLYTLFDWANRKTDLFINEQQIDQLLEQVERPKGQWQLTLDRSWVFQRVYEEIALVRKNDVENESVEIIDRFIEIEPHKQIILNEKAWVGLFTPDEVAGFRCIDDWEEFSHDVWLKPQQTLFIGKRQAGDRIQLNEKLTKKVSRYFIDKKIPDLQRKDAWVVKDEQKKIISLLPFTYSHLSIGVETDKIHYILLYKYQKEATGRRT
ncbi:MAG: tRNA lysidine(34) synthetase TilS [Enterococcus sp.]|nr:tRNA lysidine(34) synthetase TilS [Enterococcus sp.]